MTTPAPPLLAIMLLLPDLPLPIRLPLELLLIETPAPPLGSAVIPSAPTPILLAKTTLKNEFLISIPLLVLPEMTFKLIIGAPVLLMSTPSPLAAAILPVESVPM